MTDEAVVSGLRVHDRSLIRTSPTATPNLVRDLEPALRGFDEEARTLAVAYLTRYNGPGTGRLLLTLTADRSATVASAAAKSLVKVSDTPPGEAIVADIPARQDPFVRGQLYLAAGNAKAPPGLAAFRAVASKEQDPGAAEQAQAAAVKLGDDVERKAFIKRVETVHPDYALKVQDQILYIGDPKLTKALIPWFDNKEGVMRQGSDRQNLPMIRVCDLAVWIAHQLGVKFPVQPEDHLTHYDAAVLNAAKSAVAALQE